MEATWAHDGCKRAPDWRARLFARISPRLLQTAP
jgi:hypothetical protein